MNTKNARVAYLLDQAAAHAIPGDVDLWPAVQPVLRLRRRSHNGKRSVLTGIQGLAVACLAFMVISAVSPEVRTQTGAVVRQIGGLLFTNTLPRPQSTTPPSTVPPFDPPDVGQSQGMNLAEAKAFVPFTFSVPSFVPEGFYADNQVQVSSTTSKACNCVVGWTVSKVWVKPISTDQVTGNGFNRPRISLTIYQGEETRYPKSFAADLATLEELDVNGRPTALLGPEGVIPAEPRLLGLSKTLMWTDGDIVYSLRGSPGVLVQDLIRVATSIP